MNTFESRLPPGTTRIEDRHGDNLVLSPQPSSDPNQPLNWSKWRKALHMAVLCFYGLVIWAILAVPLPLWAPINEELSITYDQLNNGYAISQATLALGCIAFVPIGLKFGRRPIYIITALIMVASAAWFAKMETVNDLYGANVICGFAGAVNEALFQLTVADLFFVHQRGTMNGIFLTVVMVGNYLGPVAGGYISDSQGWRWAFWWATILMAASCIFIIFALEESKYVPVTIHGSSATLVATDSQTSVAEKNPKTQTNSRTSSVVSVNLTYADQHRINTTIPMKSYRQRHALWTVDPQGVTAKEFFQHMYRPFLMLAQFPAIMFTALQWGWVIGMLVILAVAQADTYPLPPYNFSASAVGLQNLPPAIGCVLGSIFGGPVNDYFIMHVAKRRKGVYEPESRLMLFLIPGFALTIGTLLFGLTIAQGMPWIYNAIGAGFIGFGIGGCGDMAMTYAQDSYHEILGDSLTGIVFVRNALSTALIFTVPPWMTGMGLYNMFVLIGLLTVVMALTCVPMLIWGRGWRVKCAKKYEYYSRRQH